MAKKNSMTALRDSTGDDTFAGLQVVSRLLLGWPVYLLKNDTAGRQKLDGAAGAEMALSTTAGLPPSLIPKLLSALLALLQSLPTSASP